MTSRRTRGGRAESSGLYLPRLAPRHCNFALHDRAVSPLQTNIVATESLCLSQTHRRIPRSKLWKRAKKLLRQGSAFSWLTGLSWSDPPQKPELEGIIAFILISWGSGSPLLNTDPDKILFRARASHAVRLSLSHFAEILATHISIGVPPARNRSLAFVRSVCAIRLWGTAGDASRLMMKLTTGSEFAEGSVDPAT